MDKVNVVVGPKGAGKSTVLRIVNFRGLYAHELSHSVKLLEELGFERDDLKYDVPWDDSALRLSYGHCLRYLPRPLFLSGCSRPKEIEFFEKKEIPYRVMGIDCPTEKRYKRVLERERKGESNISWEDFLIKDRRRLGNIEGFEANDLEGLMKFSEYRIINDGSLNDLIMRVDSMLKFFRYIK